LALTTAENPSETLPGVPLQAIEGPIVVVFTRSNREKSLARELTTLGLPYFLPMVTRRNTKNRTRTTLPLLPGILFAAAVAPTTSGLGLSPEDAQAKHYPVCPHLSGEGLISNSRHTFRLLRPHDQPRLRKELAFLYVERPTFDDDSGDLHNANRTFPQGTRVRFADDTAWAGMEGTVETLKTNTKTVKVVVEFSFLGRTTTIETSPSNLQPIL
jgi:hypothetical protein